MRKDLHLACIPVGILSTCCYTLWLDGRDDCVVIDPGDEADRIRESLDGHRIAAILLTHAHFDHIGAVKDLMEPGIRLWVHREDAPLLTSPELNACDLVDKIVTAPEATDLSDDGTVIEAAGMSFRVIHTPGHTRGSVCYELEDILFTGDTVFRSGFGRTDLPTGSMKDLRNSLRKLMPILNERTICPGHGG